MSFSENVVVTETSFKVLEILSFCGREMAYAPSVKITVPIFWVKNKCNEAFRGVYNWRILEKNFKSNPVLVVVLVQESEGLYWIG